MLCRAQVAAPPVLPAPEPDVDTAPPILAGQPTLVPAQPGDSNNLALMKRPVASLSTNPTPMKRSCAASTHAPPPQLAQEALPPPQARSPPPAHQLRPTNTDSLAEFLPAPAEMIRVCAVLVCEPLLCIADAACSAAVVRPRSPGCLVMEVLNVEAPMKRKHARRTS